MNDIDCSGQIKCVKLEDATLCSELLKCDMECNYQSPFSVLSVNIRSVHRNFDSFLVFVSKLGVPIDMFVLTECWINKNSYIPSISNYQAFSTKKSINQNDGVIAYVRQDINVSAVEIDIADGNCLLITLDKHYSIICSYRPPCFHNPSNYLNSLQNIISTCNTESIIFTGDINLDIMPANLNSYSLDYLTLMASFGLRPGIYCPTRINTCIDHFMIKTEHKVLTVVFEALTDHSPILLILEKSKLNRNSFCCNRVSTNIQQVGSDLKLLEWDDFFQVYDANLAACTLVSNIQDIIIKNTVVVKTSRNKKALKPWITKGVLRSMRKRDNLHRRMKKRANINNVELKLYYLKYRNLCNKIIKFLKKQYYKKQFTKNSGNIKETWRLIKEICNFNVKNAIPRELLAICGSSVDSLNKVNRYFSSVGENLANSTLKKLTTDDSVLSKAALSLDSPCHSMSFNPTDPLEVKNIIMSLKAHSAPGCDNIPTSVLRTYWNLLIGPITHVCNLSLQNGIFPKCFKNAIVIPVHKSGDKKIPSNYRPISLLSALSKVLEKLVNKRLMRYLETEGLLASNQYGFRAKRSTNDAVLKLTSNLTSYLDNGKKCVGVFLDLQKAFDTVSIPILISRLQNVGIRGIPLLWFQDYLSDRQQVVRIDNVISGSTVCTYGVPQGSTLGPSLFLIYLNELCKFKLKDAELFMFADDTAIIFHGSTWELAKKAAEDGLRKITVWLEDSLLSLNASKTKYICFSITDATKPPTDFKINIHTFPCNRNIQTPCNCTELTRVDHIRYLGVIIDDKLNWKEHVSTLTTRTRKLIYIFKSLRQVVEPKMLVQVYKALCQCILTYCICAWGGASKSHLINIERAQRAILKVMFNLPFRHPTTEVYRTANVLSVRKLYLYESIRRYHRLTVPLLPKTNKRTELCPLPRIKHRFARKHYNYLAPFVYNILNSKRKIKHYSNFKVKKVITDWLEDLNYIQTEKLLEPSM